ncbi:MAG: hypothetical protein LQ351_002617 [Letrouitia transgressa]|nr:MAG: hypothetical protein LQ351_002617 [Letrouitia transgressa]
MRRTVSLLYGRKRIPKNVKIPKANNSTPIVSIKNGTFYRQYPSTTAQEDPTNKPMYPNLTFSLPSLPPEPENWAVIGPSNTTFLEILRGQHLCFPPNARSFPFLASEEIARKDHHLRVPARALQYVGFSEDRGGIGQAGTRGAYLSARYESRREETDFSLLDYLKGNTELNPSESRDVITHDEANLTDIIKKLKLETLLEMPVGNLSNGQTRRARVARALLGKPEVLLLDGPFMGLDPQNTKDIAFLLGHLAKANTPRLVLSLRPQDPLPEWITHLLRLSSDFEVIFQGPRAEVRKSVLLHGGRLRNKLEDLQRYERGKRKGGNTPSQAAENDQPGDAPQMYVGDGKQYSTEGLPLKSSETPKLGEPLVEMNNVAVKYGAKIVLGAWHQNSNGQAQEGFQWTVRRGQRWGVFGPNGSGKTTLLSLICSDHPQTYSLPIRIFSRFRLPRLGEPGISVFDIQSRIGQSSPEIHAFFPKNLTIRQVLENAWADTFLGSPKLVYENDAAVDTCLRWFEAELNPAYARETPRQGPKGSDKRAPRSTDWADELRFRDVPFSAQRVALLLRALVKKPDLVVLDEAFSGMDVSVRNKCMLFLTWGTTKYFYVYRDKNVLQSNTIVDADSEVQGEFSMTGLTADQALICVSHVKEEVPGVVRDWMCLPEANTGMPARFGRFDGPLQGVKGGWEQIWGFA